MYLRRYRSSDLDEIIRLFNETVKNVNSRDYTAAQIKAWTTSGTDFKDWDQSLSEHYCVVAIEDGVLVGFGDISKNACLDRLYVHHNYQNRGIGTALCEELEKNTEGNIETHASITAKIFFENRGYKVLKEQKVLRNGIYLKNYVMIKTRK